MAKIVMEGSTLMVGSHDRRSLQLSQKLHIFANVLK